MRQLELEFDLRLSDNFVPSCQRTFTIGDVGVAKRLIQREQRRLLGRDDRSVDGFE